MSSPLHVHADTLPLKNIVIHRYDINGMHPEKGFYGSTDGRTGSAVVCRLDIRTSVTLPFGGPFDFCSLTGDLRQGYLALVVDCGSFSGVMYNVTYI